MIEACILGLYGKSLSLKLKKHNLGQDVDLDLYQLKGGSAVQQTTQTS